MAKLISWLLVVLAFFDMSNNIDAKASTKKTPVNVDKKLKLLNKPAVKSIQSEDGDIIDCVGIHKQPAFDHPALRNHIIQKKPSFRLPKDNSVTRKKGSAMPVVLQTWQRSGSCPEGTVPIRRIQKQDLLRASSLDHFGKKTPQVFSASNRTYYYKDSHLDYMKNTKDFLVPMADRSAAILVTYGKNYTGAKGDINVWNPYVGSPNDFTTAQIWVKGGPDDNFESLEAGWMVNPKLYGDKLTRLFVYWTKDAYKKTGCFDLTCSGFVHTSSKVALGAAIDNMSRKLGQQYYLTFSTYKDPQTSNWWLVVGDDKIVGYWPAATLMFYLNYSSDLVEWGGQVYGPKVKKIPHTSTDMGSGEFAEASSGIACYIDNIRVVDDSLQLKYPHWVGTWSDESHCYSAFNLVKGHETSPVFYFGGPGRLYPDCP